jgi:hypothetical protein
MKLLSKHSLFSLSIPYLSQYQVTLNFSMFQSLAKSNLSVSLLMFSFATFQTDQFSPCPPPPIFRYHQMAHISLSVIWRVLTKHLF